MPQAKRAPRKKAAKPAPKIFIEHDDHSPYVEFNGVTYRPRTSRVSGLGIVAFGKYREVATYTDFTPLDEIKAYPFKAPNGDQYLLMHTSSLREVWACHGPHVPGVAAWSPTAGRPHKKDMPKRFPQEYPPPFEDYLKGLDARPFGRCERVVQKFLPRKKAQ